MSSRVEIQKLCLKTLESAKIGKGEKELQNGKDFYKLEYNSFFTNYPDLRVYFKGAETFTADDVQKSQRFEKQGQRILLAVHLCVIAYTNDMIFAAYIRETVVRHRQFKMVPELWSAFWKVFEGFLSTKVSVGEDEKKAWAKLGEDFAAIAVEQHKIQSSTGN